MLSVAEVKSARMTGARISDLLVKDARHAVSDALRAMLAVSGLTIADDIDGMAANMAEGLTKKLRYRYAYLTTGELGLALEAGVCGEWGRDRRPVPANLLGWVSAYVQSDVRRSAVQAMEKESRGTSPEQLLSVGELERMNAEAAERSARREWEEYRRTGRMDIFLDGYAAMIYDYLTARGVLRPSEQAVRLAYSNSRKRAMRNRNITDMEALFSRIGRMEDTGRMDFECKRELLEMFFSDKRQKGGELRL